MDCRGPASATARPSEAAVAEARREAFAALKPPCSRLLQLRADAAGMAAALSELARALEAVPAAGLEPCWDYATFPLLIALDSAILARRQRQEAARLGPGGSGGGGMQQRQEQQQQQQQQQPPVPAAAADRVAEGLLSCLLLLVRRAPPQGPDQIVPLLEKVLLVLQLDPSVVSEEIRLKALECLEACLLPNTAGDATGDTAGGSPNRQASTPQARTALPAARALLSQPAAAPLAGALVAACLAAAESELAAAAGGSRAVRAAALRGAHALLLSMADAPDALAFFLPGLVSGFTKQLVASGQGAAGAPQTGAAAGASAVIAALEGLTDTVALVLGDAALKPVFDRHPEAAAQLRTALGGAAPPAAASSGTAAATAVVTPESSGAISNTREDVLQALERLSLASGGSGGAVAAAPASSQPPDAPPRSSGSSGRDAGTGDGELDIVMADEAGTGGSTAPAATAAAAAGPERRQLRVKKDTEWAVSSARRVQTMVAVALPPLMTHPRPAVRRAAALAAARLLEAAPTALHGSWQALTEVLLTLAQDPWPQVSGPCLEWLSRNGASGAVPAASPAAPDTAAAPGGVSGVGKKGVPSVSQLLVRLALELPPAVRAGAGSGALAAKRLATALLCSGPDGASDVLLSRPSTLERVVDGLIDCFQIDPSGAPLLLHAPIAPPGPFAAANSPSSATGGAAANTAAAAASTSSGGELVVTVAAALGGAPAAPQLPRMPLALMYLTTDDSYAAVASVARALGRLARRADPHGLQHLRRLMDTLHMRLRTAQARGAGQGTSSSGGGGARVRKGSGGESGGSWRCECASLVAMMSEVLFGASGAWRAPQAPKEAPGSKQQQQQQGEGEEAGEGVPPPGRPDPSYESCVLQLLESITSERLWGQPTTQPPRGDGGGDDSSAAAPRLSAQDLGEGALLARALCDAAGTSARCLGPRFAGRPLRATLLPLLERLGDPCPLVSDAAAGALAWVCLAVGPPGGGLKGLVGSNADYVIDGLCARLRALRRSPRAPQLLAALLQRCGVAPELLPLMAEPLRGALAALSVVARAERPSDVAPFLQVLRCVASGAGEEARTLQSAWAEVASRAREVALAEGIGADGETLESPGEPQQADQQPQSQQQQQQKRKQKQEEWLDKGGEVDSGIAEVRAYFLSRLDRRQARDGLPGGVKLEAAADDDDAAAVIEEEEPGASGEGDGEAAAGASIDAPRRRRLLLPAAQLEHLEALWRRVHAAASLAGAAADAAAPLLLQRGLRPAVLAHEVAAAALDALAASTEAAETEAALFDRTLTRGPGAALRPVRPETPRLLPAVAALWGPLLAALRTSSSVPLIEVSLSLLARLTDLAGGQFMARRVQREALPLLFRLLRDGPPAPGRPEALLAAATAPAGAVGGPGSDAAGPSAGIALGAGRSAALLGLEETSAGDSSSSGGGDRTSGGTGGFAARAAQLMAVPAGGDVVSGGAGDGGGALAPAAIARVQVAVLTCLERICASDRARASLAWSIWDIASAAAPLLADAHPLALREAAARLLAAAALADADAVWLLLFDLAAHGGGGEGAALAALEPPALAADGGAPPLPPLRQLLPAPLAAAESAGRGGSRRGAGGTNGGPSGGGPVTRELASKCGRRAQALLARLEAPGGACAPGVAAWHAKAAQQLAVLEGPIGL